MTRVAHRSVRTTALLGAMVSDLASLSAREVESALEEFFEREYDCDIEGPSSWYDIKWSDGVPCEVPGLGTLTHIDDYGGEGKGDDYWVVFSITQEDITRFFKKSGWYQSYSGGELDGELEEVTPKAKVITVWE